MNDGKIDAYMLYCVFFITRLFSGFAHISTEAYSSSGSDRLLGILLAALILPLCLLPSVLLFKRVGAEESILSLTAKASPLLCKIMALVYCLVFFWFLIITGLRFSLFASSILYPRSDISLFLLLIFACGIYAACLGLRPICRASVGFAFIIAVMSLAVLLSLIPKVHIRNFSPFLFDKASQPLTLCLQSIGSTLELSMLALLRGRLKNNSKKRFFTWLFATLGLLELSAFFVDAVLGSFGSKRMFTLYSLCSLAQLGSLRRLDAIQSAIWLLSVFIKLSFYLYVTALVLRQGFALKSKRPAIITIGGLSCLVCLILSRNALATLRALSTGFYLAAFIIAVLIVPSVGLVAKKLGGKKYEML